MAMADTDTAPGLFFAGSDDENEDVIMESEAAGPSSPPTRSTPMFLADSDEEDLATSFLTPKKRPIVDHADSDSDVEIPSFEEIPRPSSVSSVSSGRSRASSVSEESIARPTVTRTAPPPAKKRRVSTPAVSAPKVPSLSYLGSFPVGNAWSTVRGKGYVKPGDTILIQRDDQDDSKPGFKSTNKGKKKDTGKTKQLSIAAMLKSQPKNLVKKKTDHVVRLTNTRGFGVWTGSH